MANKKLKFLSLDGGGVRGAATAAFLQQFEKYLLKTKNQTIHEYFDGFIGTSTGGLLALCLASGMGGDELINLYGKSNVDRIFTETLEPCGSEYGAEKRKVFKEIFDKLHVTENKLSAAKKHCAVTAYDLTEGRALILSSIKSDNTISDITFLDAADGTSAAPTYFTPVKTLINGKENYLIDGGLIVNQPSMVAYSLAEFIDRENYSRDTIKVLSVGTTNNRVTIPGDGCQNKLAWLQYLLEIFEDTSIADLNSKASMGQDFLRINSETTFKFNGTSISVSSKFDDISQENIDKLNDLGKLWWLAFESQVVNFVK